MSTSTKTNCITDKSFGFRRRTYKSKAYRSGGYYTIKPTSCEDYFTVKLMIFLPCDEWGGLISELRFGEQCLLFGEHLKHNWGYKYYPEDWAVGEPVTYRYRGRAIISDTYATAFKLAATLAKAELKILDALLACE